MKNCRYQIKVTLKNIHPSIWRRLLVPANCTMDALHCAIQTTMGWSDVHLYAFRTQNRRIEIPDPDMLDAGWSNCLEAEDSAKICFNEVAGVGDELNYDYDFGDGWEHSILIEKAIETDDISARKAECLKGKHACPPEDCGGPWGYQRLLELLATPDRELDSDEKQTVEWIGGEWNAEAFDLDDVSQALLNWKPKQCSDMYAGICR
ncbi:MAG: plasmid pRiA4b ORF-3 family protein [Mariprofundaceae bacterium]|nr:plasmid pRiA4b ORF-3 family protein [Mariprofundaceae bacterium]